MEILVEGNSGIFGNKKVGDRQVVWMSHGDEAAVLPDGFKVVAKSEQGVVASIENPKRRLFGLQYHPEVYAYAFLLFILITNCLTVIELSHISITSPTILLVCIKKKKRIYIYIYINNCSHPV